MSNGMHTVGWQQNKDTFFLMGYWKPCMAATFCLHCVFYATLTSHLWRQIHRTCIHIHVKQANRTQQQSGRTPSQAGTGYLAMKWVCVVQGSMCSVCAGCVDESVFVFVCVCWMNGIRPEACPWLSQGAVTHLVFRLQKHGTPHLLTWPPLSQPL